jgi:leucyl/phenylalanyl-tRNA--protein transferase
MLSDLFTARNTVLAYESGFFPMAMPDGEIAWFFPKRRAILPLDRFHVSRSLFRSRKRYEVTFDQAFMEVMRHCADRSEGSWISEAFFVVYGELFDLGIAHSCEAWQDGRLVGGVYGVHLGGAFMAESMFHKATDAGKVALWSLVQRLRSMGIVLLDVQYQTPHLKSLGAIEVSHETYMRKLKHALSLRLDWSQVVPTSLEFRR